MNFTMAVNTRANQEMWPYAKVPLSSDWRLHVFDVMEEKLLGSVSQKRKEFNVERYYCSSLSYSFEIT